MVLRFYKAVLLLVTVLFSFTCTLEKEPLIPSGASNLENPVFQSVQIKAITSDTALAETKLSDLGNLNILSYGWEWAEQASVPFYNDSITFIGLKLDSFATRIPRLSIGKTYLIRPFVSTGVAGKTFGPAQTVYMGIPKLSDVFLLADSSCLLRVGCGLQSPVVIEEYGILYLEGKGIPTVENKQGKISGSVVNNEKFEVELTMLSPDTEYSVRGYAKTSYGAGYGPVQIIKTRPGEDISAGFTFNTDAEVFQGAIVTFSNASSNANSFSWDFGDGVTSTESSPVHVFNQLGQMQVRLTAINSGCAVSKDTIFKIVINPFTDYWVPVEGDTFTMGCTPEQGMECWPNEYPTHQVSINSFDIGKTEVTQGQWYAVTGFYPSYFFDCGSECPVENVSWIMIQNDFIPKYHKKTGLSVRLPTEAEWEYAARGGMEPNGFIYSGSDNLDDVAWHAFISNQKTHPVGKKDPNELGLYDMSGNVWEWCYDWSGAYQPEPQINPLGPIDGDARIMRGAAYSDFEGRISLRTGITPESRFIFNGFRLARSQ